jgi:hypothetical protein
MSTPDYATMLYSDGDGLPHRQKGEDKAPIKTTLFALLALIYASYSSYLVYYDVNNYKKPVTDNKIEIGRYLVNLLFVVISVYFFSRLPSVEGKHISICRHTGTEVEGYYCPHFTFSLKLLLVLFIMIHLYDAVITIAIYHKLIKDIALIKKLKIVSISLNGVIVLLCMNYFRELTFNSPYKSV